MENIYNIKFAILAIKCTIQWNNYIKNILQPFHYF